MNSFKYRRIISYGFMMIGIAKNTDFWQKYYLEKRLPFAKDIISKFPTLNSIFENFKG